MLLPGFCNIQCNMSTVNNAYYCKKSEATTRVIIIRKSKNKTEQWPKEKEK